MDSSSIGSQKPNFDFLVKIKGHSLKLQPEVIETIIANYGENTELPVAVISVVGRRNYNKTYLSNKLKNEFEKLSDECSTFGKEDKFPYDPKEGFENGMMLYSENGILVCTKPVVIRFGGTPFTVLFLDIWSKTATPTQYRKLVDFCYSVSSVLILSEMYSSPSKFLWKTSKSDQNQAGGEILHQLLSSVIIHGNFENEQIHLKGFYGGDFLLDSKTYNTEHSPQLYRIIKTAQSLNPNPKSWYFQSMPKNVEDREYGNELHKFVFKIASDTTNIFNEDTREKYCPISSLSSCLSQLVESMNADTERGTTETDISDEKNTFERREDTTNIPNETEMNIDENASACDSQNNAEGGCTRISTCACGGHNDRISSPEGSTSSKEVFGIYTDPNDDNLEKKGQRSITDIKPGEQSELIVSEVASDSGAKDIKNLPDQPSDDNNSQATQAFSGDKPNTSSKKDRRELAKEATKLYEYTLNNYIESQASELYINPDKLKAHHAVIKSKVFDCVKQNKIEQSEKVMKNLEIEFNKIFDEIQANNLKAEAYFQTVLQTGIDLVDEQIRNLEEQVRKGPIEFQVDFCIQKQQIDNCGENFTKNLEGKWKSYFTNWFAKQTMNYFSDLNELQRQKYNYFENMKTIWKSSICIPPNQIQGVHKECIEKLHTDTNTYTWEHDELKNLTQLAIELIHKTFEQQNSKVILKEEQAVKKGVEFAENAYNKFMKSKIEAATYANEQIKAFHETGIESSLQNFNRPPEFNRSYIWTEQREKITRILQPKLEYYLEQNQIKVYKNLLNEYIDSRASELYIDPEILQAENVKIKQKVFNFVNHNETNQPEKLVKSAEIEFDKIFNEVRIKNLKAETYFISVIKKGIPLVDSKINDEIQKLGQQVRTDPIKFQIDIRIQQQEFENRRRIFTKDLEGQWKSYFTDWFTKQTINYFSDLNELQRQKDTYFKNMKHIWESSICIPPNKIEGMHKECIKKLDKDTNNHTWEHDELSNLAQLAIELIYDIFVQHNSKAIEGEEQALKSALEFAENAYNVFMKSKIQVATYTNKQVKILHKIGIKSVLQNFYRSSKFKRSFIWMDPNEKITTALQPMQDYYIKLNEYNLQEKNVQDQISKYEKIYEEKMVEQMPSTKVTNELMDLYDMKAKKKAIKSLNDNEIKIPGRNIKNELMEKLDILRQSWENENKKKPAKELECQINVRINATKGLKRVTNAIGEEPHGVGIYFGPDIVRLEIYQESSTQLNILDWSPTIYFPGEEIIYFLKEEKYDNFFNIYNMLVECQYLPKVVKIYSNRMSLMCEEIVAIFLNKIKSEAENRFQVEIKSCVVATSAFMNTTGKQILKSALFIAGFEKSRLIQSTTAIGLSYLIQNRQIQTHRQSLAIIHNGSFTFDIATAEINQNSILINSITGTPYLDKPGWSFNPLNLVRKTDLSKYKLKLLESTLKELVRKKMHTILLVVNCESDDLTEDIRKIQLPHYVEKSFSDERQITFGAAALDASLNPNVGESHLRYTEVFPYNVIAQYGNEPYRLVTHNTHIIEQHLNWTILLRKNEYSHRLSISEKENSLINEFSTSVYTGYKKYLYLITFNLEGLLESVECKSADRAESFRVTLTQKLMNREQQLHVVEKLGFILIPPAAFSTSEEVIKMDTSPPLQTTEPAGNEEIVEKLKAFIAEVKIKLEKKATTSSKLVDRCHERIRQAETALENSETKGKLLQMEYEKLELCANKINND